jgi:hypothetical protein
LGAYPLLAGKKSNNILGPDVHQAIIINELKKYDFRISVISYGDNGFPTENINGLEIIKIQADTYRFRAVDIILKLFRIWRGMWMAKADIYFHAGGAAGITSIFCKLAN